MGKSWGLQFQNRVKDFSADYADLRLHEWRMEGEVNNAKRALAKAEERYKNAATQTADAEDALAILIEGGPNGLWKLERDTSLPGYSITQFLDAYKKGTKF